MKPKLCPSHRKLKPFLLRRISETISIEKNFFIFLLLAPNNGIVNHMKNQNGFICAVREFYSWGVFILIEERDCIPTSCIGNLNPPSRKINSFFSFIREKCVTPNDIKRNWMKNKKNFPLFHGFLSLSKVPWRWRIF